ncbi:hypothetical protein Fot_03943 [Forsythia ovata]|uniref:Uncharacterized protein n=1 Tax=Forsythia ovata TaxID=205694 RepID=A0ABD1XBA2_9LAMI
MATGASNFPKAVGSNSSCRDPMLIYSGLPGGRIEVQDALRSWKTRSLTPEEGSSWPRLALRGSSASSMPLPGTAVSPWLPMTTFFFLDHLKFSVGDTGLVRSGTEGTPNVISSAKGTEGKLLTIVPGASETEIPITDAAHDTEGRGGISSTTPPHLILSFGTLEK